MEASKGARKKERIYFIPRNHEDKRLSRDIGSKHRLVVFIKIMVTIHAPKIQYSYR